MERCPTQAVLPVVGLAAEKVIRDPYITIVRTHHSAGRFLTGLLPPARACRRLT
ncbi:MAG: hypothetical protein R6U98_12280 [Pirellulaceae bacterium]